MSYPNTVLRMKLRPRPDMRTRAGEPGFFARWRHRLRMSAVFVELLLARPPRP